ncbi:GNAT family N-acetyltransferase [Duganella rhizosphaerae]|uniref:GNAT family N-acetyltransferase n=1 Tax=Duganella rhizosphaerae TaxID=2885763 RepID=UPI00403F6C0E
MIKPTELLSVREACIQDRRRVQEIAAESMRHFGLEPDFATLDIDLGRFGAAATHTVAQLVAEIGGSVIGSLILTRKDSNTLKLTGFYVHGSARGKGAGKALLHRAIAAARSHGYTAIYLETWSQMHSAVHLYKSFGWTLDQALDPSTGAEWSYVLQIPGAEGETPTATKTLQD